MREKVGPHEKSRQKIPRGGPPVELEEPSARAGLPTSAAVPRKRGRTPCWVRPLPARARARPATGWATAGQPRPHSSAAAPGPARAAACVRLGCRAAFDSFSVRNSAAVEYSSAVVMRLWCAAAAPLPARTRRANKSDGKMSAGRAETLKCGLTRAALTRPRPTASRAYVSEPRHASIRTPVTPYSNQRHKRRLPLADGWPVRTTSGCQACLTSSISLCRSSIASATAIATNAKSSFCATDEPAAVST